MAIDKRLKNVQQADLTESRVNDDFVFMLRRFGPNVLIAVLLLVAVLMGVHWYYQRVERERDTAWMDLKQATVPAALLEVASQHPDKGALANFAELTAADTYLLSINRGIRFDREASVSDKDITPEIRAEWLKEADRLYAKVADATKDATTLGGRMMHVAAIFGRAAVAEDRHDVPAAEAFLKQIEEVVKATDSAALGQVAAERRARLQDVSAEIVFVSNAPLNAAPAGVVPIGAGSPAPVSSLPTLDLSLSQGAGAQPDSGTQPTSPQPIDLGTPASNPPASTPPASNP